MNQQQKEKLILEWLNDSLDESELIKSISQEEVDQYKAILHVVDNWEPEGSQPNESRFSEIFSTKGAREAKVVSLNRTSWFMGIAASIVLIATVTILFFGNQKTEYLADQGNLEVRLPDNSTTVILSPGARLSYKNFDPEDREVTIEGRVYFDVTQKGNFSVRYPEGIISVLGTQFEVITYDDLFETACFEGKVRVDHRGETETLSKKERVLYFRGNLQKSTMGQDAPGWLDQSVEKFDNDRLVKVIKVVEERFKVKIDVSNISVNRRFTGSIPTDNLEEACRRVFTTLGIEYTIQKDKVILTE